MPEETSQAGGQILKKTNCTVTVQAGFAIGSPGSRDAWFRPQVSTNSATSDQLRVSWVVAALIGILIYFIQEHTYLSIGGICVGRKSGHNYCRKVTNPREP
jgi:hypothetical protein